MTESRLLAELSTLRQQVQQLTEELRTARQGGDRYKLLLENLHLGVFVTSLDGVMLECNDRVAHMAGEPNREALLGRVVGQRWENPEDRQTMVQRLRETGAVRGFEAWVLRPNGERQCSAMTAVLAPLGPNGETCILGMLEDITERKRAEARAGEGEERFRVIAEQSLLGIAIMQDNQLKFVNQAIADLAGYSIQEMSSWNAIDFAKMIHPEDLAFATEQARKKQAGESGAMPQYSYRMLNRTGEVRWVEQYSRSIEYQGRPANFVTIIDITARKEAERSLSQMAQSMERAAKLESLGVLAAGIAHDFNNLLSGVYGHIDLARDGTPPSSASRDHLYLAHQSLERARSLTAQLLAFAKGGAPVRKIGSLQRCVMECADFALSGSNVKAEIDLEPGLWPAEFDENQLSQAFGNVVLNAKQAMPQGGTLRISGRNVQLPVRELSLLKPGRYIKLSFTDQGGGIDPEILGRIFDPFFTTKFQGTGLGLTTTYAIVKKHDGNVEADSQPGKGATFHVWLPAATVAGPVSPKPEARVPAQGRGIVLVMDDDDTVRRVAGSMLSRLGYEPLLTTDGADALLKTKALLDQGNAPVVALLDLTVRSGQGGRETVGPLRELAPHLPIIASSGYSDDPIMATPERFGFSASLSKPFRLADLAALLGRIVSAAAAGE